MQTVLMTPLPRPQPLKNDIIILRTGCLAPPVTGGVGRGGGKQRETCVEIVRVDECLAALARMTMVSISKVSKVVARRLWAFSAR